MQNEIDSLTESFGKLSIASQNIDKIILIQKHVRGYLYRLKYLPLIMYVMKRYLRSEKISLSSKNQDGRVNSSTDEDIVISKLVSRFGDRIKVPKIRMWYDILVRDYRYGWLPINIKTTTTLTYDNTGNLTMCVYAYTDYDIYIHREKTYQNGEMSRILSDKLRKKQYNKKDKRDYYFLVLDKTNPDRIIVNTLKGLQSITPNINNLPFQVCWSKNRIFKYAQVHKRIREFIQCLQKMKPSWKETFISDIKSIKLEK